MSVQIRLKCRSPACPRQIGLALGTFHLFSKIVFFIPRPPPFSLDSLWNFSIVGCQWTVNCLLGFHLFSLQTVTSIIATGREEQAPSAKYAWMNGFTTVAQYQCSSGKTKTSYG